MDLGRLISLGATTAQDAWSWLLILSLAAKVGSTLALLGLKAGLPWRPVARHGPVLWWTTKLSALAICASAALLCRAGGDRAGTVFFAALLLLASGLVAARVQRRRVG